MAGRDASPDRVCAAVVELYWFDLWRATIGGEPPAVLIVAPLSLLENWKTEIDKSYGDGGSVFRRVLLAQPDVELNRVRRHPGSCDKAVPGEVLEYGLGFGDGTERSVDLPRSCVLTTIRRSVITASLLPRRSGALRFSMRLRILKIRTPFRPSRPSQ